MSSAQTFISFDGLAANVQVTMALIEEYNIELSAVKQRISHLTEEQAQHRRKLLLSKAAMREELLRQIEDLKEQEIIEAKQLEAEFDVRRAPFEDEMKSILAKIDVAKGSIAPVRKLPAEILGNIFREVVSRDVSPWLLATVSKSWRITSLTTPSLWSNIYVGKLDYRIGSPSRWTVEGELRYTSGNRMLCRNLDELTYYGEKSGVVPLDVLIGSNLTPEKDEVLQGLLGPPYSSRIFSISLSSTKLKDKMAGWTIGPFPLLRKLSCASLQEPIIDLLLSEITRLDSFTAWVGLSREQLKHPVWSSLLVLHMGYHTKAHDFNLIASELGSIEEISGIPRPWPDANTPTATLGQVKSLNLTCRPEYLARLRLPQLKTLLWSQTTQMLIQVENLSHDLHWNHSFPNVVRFEAFAAGETFETTLEYVPNVQNVLLKPYSNGGRDLWALDLLKRLASAENMLCPQVRRLTVGSSTSRIGTNKTSANPIIRRLIKHRVQLGIPLEHLEISWSWRSGKPAEIIQYI